MEHNDELYLKQTVGNRNPFSVPDGYFEQLTEQVMQQLPARERPIAPEQPATAQPVARKQALMLGVSYYFMQSPAASTDAAPMAAAAAPAPYVAPDNSYIDDAADYAMLDNTEIYACLSEY